MGNSPLISVIVPVYNVEKYLSRCIESIHDQTYRNLEIILVDDGSTDASGRLCDEYSHKDNRIVVVHQKNGGISAARNAGLKRAQGEYIGFVDGDDYIHQQMYETLMTALNETDYTFVMILGKIVPDCDVEMIVTSSSSKRELSKDDLIMALFNRSSIYGLSENISCKLHGTNYTGAR